MIIHLFYKHSEVRTLYGATSTLCNLLDVDSYIYFKGLRVCYHNYVT